MSNNEKADQFWDRLSYEQKLMAFYSVSKRIWHGDVIDQGSYRHVLYDVFGFNMDAYAIGMECHYFDLHNLLSDCIDKKEQNHEPSK